MNVEVPIVLLVASFAQLLVANKLITGWPVQLFLYGGVFALIASVITGLAWAVQE